MNLTWTTKAVLLIVVGVIALTISMHFISLAFKVDLSNYLTIVGFFFLAVSALLLYFQIRTGLSLNSRKAAFDFSITIIPSELVPLFAKLIDLTGAETVSKMLAQQKVLELTAGANTAEEKQKAISKTIIAILNFYERMAIGIYKQVLDNDICYDDIGNNVVAFYPWVRPFIDSLQRLHEEERLFVNFEALALHWTNTFNEVKKENMKLVVKTKQRQTIINKKI